MKPTNGVSRQIVLATRPEGKPRTTDFRLEETGIPTPSSGELLLAVRYLSLDPYMRGRMDDRKSYASPTLINGVMEGETIAEVILSKHPDYAAGDLVLSRSGWRTHEVSDGSGITKLDSKLAAPTTALGVLGMPGFTAYAGLLNIGNPSRARR
jgi:NADPH-dependent curcumin reductase CurA